MTKCIKIYVPLCDFDSQFVSKLEETETAFAQMFGGYTSYTAHGGWLHCGRLIRDNLTIVEAYTDDVRANDVRRLAAGLAGFLSEKCIAITLDGRMEHIGADWLEDEIAQERLLDDGCPIYLEE